jgi:hypothetical protein
MRRTLPRPLVRSVTLTTLLVWAVPRAILTAGAQAISSAMGTSADLSYTVLLLLNIAVAGIVYLDLNRSRERVFAANLGVSPLAILVLSSGTALVFEILLALLPDLASSLLGG